jgi:hypothetical protein
MSVHACLPRSNLHGRGAIIIRGIAARISQAFGLGLAAVALAMVSAGSAARAPASLASGVRGRVMQGPTKPICQVGDPCEEPAPGVILVFSRSGKVAGRAKSNQSGAYSLKLRPGRYYVRATHTPLAKTLKPTSIRVPRGRFSRITFHLDTGIQ